MLAMVRGPLGGGRASITTGLLCEVWDDGKLPQPRKMVSKHRKTPETAKSREGVVAHLAERQIALSSGEISDWGFCVVYLWISWA